MAGAFCLVLHTHLPYLRRHGAWPCGEDWFHQAASDSYLPLAATFRRLAADGLPGSATMTVSPVLATQLADPYMLRELHLYLGRLQLRAEGQASSYRGPHQRVVRDLAAWEHRRATGLLSEFEERWSAGLHLAFRELGDLGAVELITSFAGHPFVPLLRDDGLALGQLRAGIAEHRRLFGSSPAGAWLPECGYRPATGGRPGVEDLLQDAGLAFTVVDQPTFEAAGLDVRAPVLIEGSQVRAFARDMETSYLVWSPTGGYPGGPWYRDAHGFDPGAGFRSYRVTDTAIPAGGKEPYEPARAEAAARADAERFAGAVESRARGGGLVVACFDTELFGHWWFEGPVFLDALLRRLADAGRVDVLSLSAALERHPPEEKAALPPSSWGRGKDTSAWLTPATEPIWSRIWEGEVAVRRALGSEGDPRVLGQALRELLLLAASDWPFMVARGRTADYARQRVEAHDLALRSVLAGHDDHVLSELEERDNPFPSLDPDDFR